MYAGVARRRLLNFLSHKEKEPRFPLPYSMKRLGPDEPKSLKRGCVTVTHYNRYI
jgi:hypothetical protein